MAKAKIRSAFGRIGEDYANDTIARDMNSEKFSPGTGERMEPERRGVMPEVDFGGECPNEMCECGEPLTRWFETYEGFSYIFKYGACADYCGNTEDKFSVVLMPRNGILEGREQCICVKRPMVTCHDDANFVDVEIGTSNLPLASFMQSIKSVSGGCPVNINDIIEVCTNIYRHEFGELDLGFDPIKNNNPIAVSVTEPLIAPVDIKRFDANRLDNQGRLIVTFKTPADDAICKDGIVFTVFGMELIRQIVAAINVFLNIVETSTFVPNFYDIFARNIRHEIANNYYPDGYMGTVKFVADASGFECDCENNMDQN